MLEFTIFIDPYMGHNPNLIRSMVFWVVFRGVKGLSGQFFVGIRRGVLVSFLVGLDACFS